MRSLLPTAMIEAQRWILWKSIPQAGKKPRKVPFYADGEPRNGTLDTPEDLARLVTFDRAENALRSGHYAGLGFALGPDGAGGNWQGIDFDYLSKWPELLEMAPQLPGYLERSPSGDGIHAIGYGRNFETIGSSKKHDGVEAYSSRRFFTVTGNVLAPEFRDIEDLEPFVTERLLPIKSKRRADRIPNPIDSSISTSTSGPIDDLCSALSVFPSDDRDLWVRIGMALKSLGDHGYALWYEWSQKSDFFDPRDMERRWKGFNPTEISYPSVFHEAEQWGWKNPAKGRKKQKIPEDILKIRVSGVSGVRSNNNGASEPNQNGLGTGEVGLGSGYTMPGIEDRPQFEVLDEWTDVDGRRLRPGVWFFGIKTKKEEIELFETWICSPLHIDAVTADPEANNLGRLLRFKTTLGGWREWAMPCELLAGDLAILRAELLGMGVEMDPMARTLLGQYLSRPAPKRRIRCALSIGWCGHSFVLPDEVIGPEENVIFQSGERGNEEYTKGGTLDGWRHEVATLANGNPTLLLGISAAFSGPLLSKIIGESGGVHYVGDSSTGKTTIIDAACSVWGGANFKRSWRSTGNGMEGAAAMFNDCLLALDEISECDPKEVGAIVYSLGNGRGKQRASRSGRARPITRWKCFVISSGERTIATTMSEGGHRVKAGQSVRLLDIPVSRKHGAWDYLHDFPDGKAMSDAIKTASLRHHGYAGREFLRLLTQDTRNLSDLLNEIKQRAEFSPEGAEGQDKRAASRFALIALAGELATDYGITNWAPGSAIEAALWGFGAWRSMRGSGNDERKQIKGAISRFLDRHGDGRFSARSDRDATRQNRAGWYEDSPDGRIWHFNGDGLREALSGFDFDRALDELISTGILKKGSDGRRSSSTWINGNNRKTYRIFGDKLNE